MPVLLAVAARPSDPGPESELLAELIADPAARVLRPRALSREAVTELVRGSLSAQAHDEFCAACHEASRGNPFLVRELMVELGAERSLGAAADAARVSQIAPATIQRAVLVRIARLPEPAVRLARAVAVLGDDVEPRLAGALARLEPVGCGEAADALESAGILESGRPLRFVHPLVRNAVYADLPGADRAAAHRDAAGLLESERAEPERIAVHLLATEPAGDDIVVGTLTAAAQRALERAAPEAAITYTRRALAEPPAPGDRRELLWHLVRASFRAGDRAALRDLESDVFDELTADPQMLIASAEELVYWLYAYGEAEQALSVLDRAAAAAVEAGDYDLAIRFTAGNGVSLQHLPPTAADPVWERYRDRVAPDSAGERLLFTLRAWRGLFMGESAATVTGLVRRALEDGKIFHEQQPSTVHGVLINMLLRADDLDEAERAIEQFSAIAPRGGLPSIAGAHYFRGALALARGDVAQAEPDAWATAETLRQAGLAMTFPTNLALLIDVLVERGQVDAAEHELQASGVADEMPDIFQFGLLHQSRAWLRLAQGRTAEGLEDIAELLRRSRRYGIRNVASTPITAAAAMALARLREDRSARNLVETYRQTVRDWGAFAAIALTTIGRGRPARGMAELYLRAARAWGTPRTIGVGLHALGIAEGGKKGIDLLKEAVATLERSPARLEHAKALTDLGAALRRANRRAEAREPLREALSWARSTGAVAVARRAHEELEATGERLRPLMAAGVESLTPSERRVAEMAAEGHSNREIAQSLFLTVKTVETHLSHAYRKLDIRSRRELAGALGRVAVP